jgi:serine acetyltransferase
MALAAHVAAGTEANMESDGRSAWAKQFEVNPEPGAGAATRFALDDARIDQAYVPGDPLATATQLVRITDAQLIGALISPSEADELEAVAGRRIAEDLLSYCRDPAAIRRGGWAYVFYSVGSFRAVASYRIAHRLLEVLAADDERSFAASVAARQISECARRAYDVEINPHARIGAKFVIDHGTGTVIGEDTVIGEECVLLDHVRLGARRIADGEVEGRRHPTLGDRVQVSYNVSVLGPVEIGEGSIIGPECVVTRNIEAHRKVRLSRNGRLVENRLPEPAT